MSRKHYRLSNGIVGRVSVISLGEINEEMSKQMSWWHFERTGKHYRYQPGFHSKRPVTFPDGTKSGIDCRVVRLDNVIAPRFKCTATHPKTGLIVDVIESSASAAANKILDLLDVNTNKRWSGPEFFGFTKPDVARELMKDSEHFLPEHFNKRKKFMDEKNASTNQAIESWNMVKYSAPKDLLFSNLYAPTMVSSLANDAMVKNLENGIHSLSSTSNHNSPTRNDNNDNHALNGLLLNGNGSLPGLVLNSLATTHSSPVTSNTSPVSTGSRSEEALNVTWVELQSVGKAYPTPDQFWFYKHSNRRYRLQPGYRALRCARNTSNEEVFILSEILAKEGRPFYRCSCKNSSREDFNSTKVVQEFMKEIDIPTKKAWAGPDFFGLTRSAVLQQLLATEQEEKLCAITPTYLPSPISPVSRANVFDKIQKLTECVISASLFEPLSQYLDSQGYRNINHTGNLKNPFTYPGGKLPTSMNSPIAGLTMPPLNGQLMQSGINSMLSVSPDMLSPRFMQSLPNFMNAGNSPVTSVPSNGTLTPNRSSFSRYMCVNMTECIRQLKLFINSLYALQQDDKMNLIQLQKLNTDMERLMLLLKNETADLNQKINSVDKKAFVSPASGFIKLECDGDGRLVDQSTETDPSSGINLELEKLREVLVQCNSCQNSVTFCSGCGGRLALFVPGSTTGTSAAEAVSTSPDDATVVKSEAAVSSSAETTNGSPKTEEKPSNWPLECDKISEHACKKIKLNNKGL